MSECKYSELTTLEGESFPCPNCGATITFDDPRHAWCRKCRFYLSIEDVENCWTAGNEWDYRRSGGRRCNHLRCSYSDEIGEYVCNSAGLSSYILTELVEGETGDSKCWSDEELAKVEIELSDALELVRDEMLARRSSDGQKVAEAFHPGVHIADEVEARGWKVGCLEHASGVNRWVLDQIMNGHGSVTEEVADRLAEAFGSDAQTWLNLQAMYDEHMNAKRAEL